MKKKRSLLKRIAVGLIVFGLFVLFGCGIAAGYKVYQVNIDLYQDVAYSYTEMVAYNLNSTNIEDAAENLGSIRDFYQKAASGEEPEADDDTAEKYYQWNGTLYFLNSICALNKDIRHISILIPDEDGVVYLWDSTVGKTESHLPMDRRAYFPGEKEAIRNVMDRMFEESEESKKLSLWNDEKTNEIIGTLISCIPDSDGNVGAVVLLDISVTDIRTDIIAVILNIAIILAIIIAACCVIYFLALRKKTIQPLVALKESASHLVDDLENGTEGSVKIDIHTRDEIEELADAFTEMEDRLRVYIRENEAAAVERERIATEMELAARIQIGMLPDIASAVSGIEEVEISAGMDPARAVGGDFYDVFPVDESHLALVMADVSGKGVPAALFMMMAKGVIRRFTIPGRKPAEILSMANISICDNNPNDMFVTVWLGILDLETGVLQAANAGHEYPVIKSPDGSVELYKDPHSFVIGTMKKMKYKEYELSLEAGSGLFLYTDGVPEATDGENVKLGNERMVEALKEAEWDPPEKVLRKMDEAIKAFVKDAEQFDDITMMCVIYKGNSSDEAAAPPHWEYTK